MLFLVIDQTSMERKEIKNKSELQSELSTSEEICFEFYDFKLHSLARKIKSQIYKPKAKTIFL